MKKLTDEKIEEMATNAIIDNIKKHEDNDRKGIWSYYTIAHASPPKHNENCMPDRYIVKSEKAMLINFAKKIIEKINK